MFKKLVSIILAVTLLISVQAIPASAEETTITSGSCGYNLTWEYNAEKYELTISGTGDMFNYADADVPWGEIKTLIIEEGVTSIGDYAFDWSSVENVTLPESLERIGTAAFDMCIFLEDIVIPEGVKTIGEGAFGRCDILKSVTLPESLLIIEDSAFAGAYALETITIPGNVERIGDSAFNSTGLTSVTIKNGVKIIDDAAFSGCRALESIIVPNTVEHIGTYAFYDCNALAEITLPDGVNYIGPGAFEFTALYNNNENWTDDVLYINNHVIQAKEEISGHYSIKPGTKTVAESAFGGCVDLTGVSFPDSLLYINDYAFSGSGITELSLPSNLITIGYEAFGYTQISSLVIPESVKYIYDYAFSACTSLTDVTIPDTVEYMGERVFETSWNIWSEEEMELQNHLLYIDNYLFAINNYLAESCTIPEGTKTIGAGALWGTDWALSKVTIPSGITTIGKRTFDSCKHLKEVIIPETVHSIGKSAFNNTQIYNDSTKWDNGVLYIQNCLIETKDTIAGKYEVKPGTRVIADYAFAERTHIEEIVLPDGLTDIGENAFYGCSDLETITIPDSVKNIDASAFAKCKSLKNIYYGGSKWGWKNINISDRNEWLNAATVDYAVMPYLKWNADNNTLTVKVTDSGEFLVLFANYGEDGMKALVPVKLTFNAEGEQTVNVPLGITTNKMKAFLWKSFANAVPEAARVDVGWN